jgi:hypothetical protein
MVLAFFHSPEAPTEEVRYDENAIKTPDNALVVGIPPGWSA